MGRSLFPSDAVARIYRPSRSETTSAPSRDQWKLVFEARSPSFIEPLMGYTGSRDTLKQVELKFPTLASATRYAQRQGLCYVVDVPKDKARITMDKSGEKRTHSPMRRSASLASPGFRTSTVGPCRMTPIAMMGMAAGLRRWMS